MNLPVTVMRLFHEKVTRWDGEEGVGGGGVVSVRAHGADTWMRARERTQAQEQGIEPDWNQKLTPDL